MHPQWQYYTIDYACTVDDTYMHVSYRGQHMNTDGRERLPVSVYVLSVSSSVSSPSLLENDLAA
jgi:hypothetical protein